MNSPHQVYIHIEKAGMQTLIVDQGRSGYQQFGVPLSGAMDKTSATVANWLVNNARDQPVLEITLIGPRLHFDDECQIALTGADLGAILNGSPIPMYETVEVDKGARIEWKKPNSGCRAYLAVGGSPKLVQWLGSYSPLLPTSMRQENPTPESVLQADTRLLFHAKEKVKKRTCQMNVRYRSSESPISIRILAGPEYDRFSRQSLEFFFSTSFEVTSDANRMGYRLKEGLPDVLSNAEVISSGIIPGTIQITASGQPIILLADAQTSGGYPRIGNVITADLDDLAQAKPGDQIRFSLVNLDTASTELARYRSRLMDLGN